MRIDIITVFPEMVASALEHSIVKRAVDRALIEINVIGLREFTTDRHRTTDDLPYGGGGGMVMKVEPIARALSALCAPSVAPVELSADETATAEVRSESNTAAAGQSAGSVRPAPRIVLTDPRGPQFTQRIARTWALEPHLVIICGHYEGVDERVRKHLVTDEISIGDYILTGGELPALVITDALTRLQPGALGDTDAPDRDTFEGNLLEYPHYTRPRDYSGWPVPDILLCGHHARIERWRRWRQLRDTKERRPDLFAQLSLSKEDQRLVEGPEPTAPLDGKAPKTGAAREDIAITAGAAETSD